VLPFLQAERPSSTTLLGDRAAVKKNHSGTSSSAFPNLVLATRVILRMLFKPKIKMLCGGNNRGRQRIWQNPG
jgi:hypothetical protein